MLDKIKVLAPAKLNIFLKVVGRRKDGLHNIRSGITFINLYDELEIKISDKLKISYHGPFKPINENYDDCIIAKSLNFFALNKDINLDIKIKKNIPVQGGLGSASTNAAALIKGLNMMKLIKKKEPKDYAHIGADIPCFLYNKNCLVMGIGDKIYPYSFPKYYFLIVKPNFNNSTKEMYHKLKFKKNFFQENLFLNQITIKNEDTGNDFEKIIFKHNVNSKKIYNYLENIDNTIFSRMTGSGSCFYSVFYKKQDAINAKKIFKSQFTDLWTFVGENNLENNNLISH